MYTHTHAHTHVHTHIHTHILLFILEIRVFYLHLFNFIHLTKFDDSPNITFALLKMKLLTLVL